MKLIGIGFELKRRMSLEERVSKPSGIVLNLKRLGERFQSLPRLCGIILGVESIERKSLSLLEGFILGLLKILILWDFIHFFERGPP